MNAAHVNVSIDVAETHVTFACDLTGGRRSFRVTALQDDVTVYLTGTIEGVSPFLAHAAEAVARHAIDEVERATTPVRS